MRVCGVLYWSSMIEMWNLRAATCFLSTLLAYVPPLYQCLLSRCRSSDDWITFVYDMFGFTSKLTTVKVVHKTATIRYGPQSTEVRSKNLKTELGRGSDTIQSYSRSLGIAVAITSYKTYDTV